MSAIRQNQPPPAGFHAPSGEALPPFLNSTTNRWLPRALSARLKSQPAPESFLADREYPGFSRKGWAVLGDGRSFSLSCLPRFPSPLTPCVPERYAVVFLDQCPVLEATSFLRCPVCPPFLPFPASRIGPHLSPLRLSAPRLFSSKKYSCFPRKNRLFSSKKKAVVFLEKIRGAPAGSSDPRCILFLQRHSHGPYQMQCVPFIRALPSAPTIPGVLVLEFRIMLILPQIWRGALGSEDHE